MSTTRTQPQPQTTGGNAPSAGEAATLKRILLATAGRANAAGALRIAAELGRRHGAEVVAVTVFQPAIPLPLIAGEVPHAERAQQDEIDRQSAIVRKVLAQGGVRDWPHRMLIGERGQSIVQEGARRDVDVIVLGLGREEPDERGLGDRTMLRVACGSDRPVLAVCRALDHLPSKVVLAVGGNGECVRIARLVSAIAAEGAKVHLVHVREADANGTSDRQLETTMGMAETVLDRAGLKVVRKVIDRGTPLRGLLTYSHETGADLIAGGLHGDGFPERTVIRNVILHVAAESRCSVLMVPRGERQEGDEPEAVSGSA